MDNAHNIAEGQNGFHLNKWFLDCVSEQGEAMIFYTALLQWHGLEVPYTSWLRYDQRSGTAHQSRYRNIHFPENHTDSIYWNDPRFNIEGTWEARAARLEARIFESVEGYLDWNCYQPASTVNLRFKDKIIKGTGYAEQLILTVEPWKLPMDELRWGRFCSSNDHLVWIELKQKERQQWLWHNGEKIEVAAIEDMKITLPEKGLRLDLGHSSELESEKKVLNVVRNLIHFIPGINRVMPLRFLMADEYKWLSRGILRKKGQVLGEGMVIHEFVNFNHLNE